MCENWVLFKCLIFDKNSDFSLCQLRDHTLLICHVRSFKAFFPVPIEFDMRLSGELDSVLFFLMTELADRDSPDADN